MNILIDLSSVGDYPSGLPLMALNISYMLIEQFPENNYHLIFFRKIPGMIKKCYIDRSNVYTYVLSAKRTLIMRIISLPKIIRKIHADWNLFFSFPAPLFISGRGCISVVHDLTAWKYPETMTKYSEILWKIRIRNAIARSEILLTVSNTVKQELVEQFGRKSIDVIYPGLTLPGRADAKYIERFHIKPFSYILSVATLEPRKNLELLVKAYIALKEKEEINVKLVLAGGKGWKLDDFDILGHIQKDIIITGYVNDDELASLYKYAKLFVLPSIYEGFGSPVIEAIASETRVLISDIPVFREITNNRAIYFDTKNKEDLMNKMRMCVKTCTEVDRKLIKFNKKYSWSEYANSVMKIMGRKHFDR